MSRLLALAVLVALLPGCVPTTSRAPVPVASVAAPDNILWARKDGRRMSTDPELYQQGTVDKEYCAQEASGSGQLDFPTFAKCMDRSGYVQIRAPGQGDDPGAVPPTSCRRPPTPDENVRPAGANLQAEDGSPGLLLLEEHPEVKLLFTDVVLTRPLNGRKVAEDALSRRPDLKVLFTTGYTPDAIIHHGRLDEDVEFIGKPFTAQDLTSRVRRILDA